MRGRPPKYTDRHRYMIEVLNLHGLSAARIAVVMRLYSVPMTDKAVQAMVWRLPYRREEMPKAVRQRLLDRLRAGRLDRHYGKEGLPDEFFKVNDE